jgi:hypothetical protein
VEEKFRFNFDEDLNDDFVRLSTRNKVVTQINPNPPPLAHSQYAPVSLPALPQHPVALTPL